ncbi:winged helix-turn-helix transcriptional regulator [Caulobacter henricii]|uniref:HxlR family transcriptional regulator n=1 Tax=Caulobacter henricii TaxID=69395 RepID=A0A0P0P131_9CAUL|nr:helix-turn-helix domain-containing protein [Caulobacter henricii]ALL14227.1 HxlR family transcriptional regulator [Caulobacter henricii]
MVQTATVASATPTLVRNSSAARALNLIGDRWTLLVLYAAFNGVNRFDGFIAMTGMARSLLVDRLGRLEAAGILERRPYQTRPLRHEYHLTAMGLDLYDSALMLLGWEMRWRLDPDCPSHQIVHSPCGQALRPVLVCQACAAPVKVRDISLQPGPGAGVEPAPRARHSRRASDIPGSDGVGGVPFHPMLERSIEVLGDRWTAHLVAASFYGLTRFKDIQAELKVASNILTDRLSRLVERGMLEKRLYQTRPDRWEYRLTREGRDFFPLIAALMAWGDRWLSGEAGPPEILTHACGARLVPTVRCNACDGAVSVRTTTLSAPTA